MDGNAITIRPARPEELPYIEKVQQQWAISFEGYSIWPSDMLRMHLGPYFLVAEDEYGAIVRYAIASRRAEKGEEPKHLAIQDLYVLRRHRGEGVASQLLSAMIAQARADRWEIVRLTPACEASSLDRLEAFYERHGFRWEEPPRYMRLALLGAP